MTGLELDREALELARHSTHAMGLGQLVEFFPAEKDRIPLPGSTFDALVSEFIVYPTTAPTQIGQPEMARVLKPGGKMILTDVIVTQPLPAEVRQALAIIGMDYLCDGTPDDFRRWMAEAKLVNVEVQDLTSLARSVWVRYGLLRLQDHLGFAAEGHIYSADGRRPPRESRARCNYHESAELSDGLGIGAVRRQASGMRR